MTTRTEPMRDGELRISRTFKAPLSLVWRLWEDRDHMRRWWGPEGFSIKSLDADFRPGGKWRVHMHSEQWGESFSGGVFREIDKLKKIVFTFAWEEGTGEPTETLVTVTFDEKDGATTQHFHQTPFSSVASRDGQVVGWNSLFNKEQRYAEAVAKGEMPPPLD
jgi:uncharacterized protein YndB with AHSA1/START domain